MAGKGRKLELDTSGGLSRVTTEDVTCTIVGYSGSSTTEACDLRVAVNSEVALERGIKTRFDIELKNYSCTAGNRTRVTGSHEGDCGYDEVVRLCDVPSWVEPVWGMKFSRREINAMSAHELVEALRGGEIRGELFEARLTGSDAISFRKPTADDEWPTASSGDPTPIALAKQLDLPLVEDPYELL